VSVRPKRFDGKGPDADKQGFTVMLAEADGKRFVVFLRKKKEPGAKKASATLRRRARLPVLPVPQPDEPAHRRLGRRELRDPRRLLREVTPQPPSGQPGGWAGPTRLHFPFTHAVDKAGQKQEMSLSEPISLS
jgi:hypothetical protein